MIERIAAAYLRRSYASAGRPGDASEETQLEAVRRLSGPDVTIYRDWGVSGRKADRPEYVRLKADIVAGKVASVCAYSLSRLGRSTRELLDFVDLCKEHDVTLRTSVESLDTSGAMGRLLFVIMAGIAQFEADITADRMAGVMAARKAAAEAAGQTGPLPNSVPLYGTRHRKVDGVVVREPNPDQPIQPVIDAYRKAGTLHGAVRALAADGVPAPRGIAWHPETLRRVLAHHAPGLLPAPTATGQKRPKGKPAAFRGLIVCHCGGLMTPNLARRQYRCSRGEARIGTALHGPAVVTERRVIEAVQAEVERIPKMLMPVFGDPDAEDRDQLAETKRRAGVRYQAGELPDAQYLALVRDIDARLAAIAERQAPLVGVRVEGRPDLADGDPAEVNGTLRHWWHAIRLDPDMKPHVEWLRQPEAKADRAA